MDTKPITKESDASKHSSPPYEKDHIYDIDLSLVIPNPMQPRKNFDDVALAALADSIKKHGLLQPISVRMITKSNGSRYFELIAGERRLRAIKMLGWESVPARIIDMTENESGEMALIENIMREELNVFEYGTGISTILNSLDNSTRSTNSPPIRFRAR